MRRAGAALIALLGLLASDGVAKPPPGSRARGFDHARHGAAVAKAKTSTLACLGCHDAKAPTAPRGHRACFGKCHGKRPRKPRAGRRYSIDPKRQAICTACHAKIALKTLSATGVKPPTVTMPLPIRVAGLPLTTGPFPVGRAFSHARHASRSKATCAGCHGGVMRSLNNNPKRPQKAACASCHDGATAFAMVEAKCRRCHLQKGTRILRHTTKLVRFSHKAHAKAKAGDCNACHTLTGNGTPSGAARNHAPCSNNGCHSGEFKSLTPKICGTCHVAKEPWRPLHRDRGPAAETEFGARFSHKAHLGGAKARAKTACKRCHNLASGKREMRPLRDHAACLGKGCHARTAKNKGAKPPLSRCTSCHELELMRKHQLRRHTSRWSVRTKFRHQRHRKRSCLQCHTTILTSVALRDAAPPAKSRCMACHDGRSAFKITGHKCARCHGGDR